MESSSPGSSTSLFARRTASSSLGSVASTSAADTGTPVDGSASAAGDAKPSATMETPRRIARIVLPSNRCRRTRSVRTRAAALRRLVPHELAAFELGTRLRLVQPERLPPHRPERLAHGAARVAPILPGLPSDRPMHTEAVREIGAHGVEARVDRRPGVLELDLEEVLLREAVADAPIGVRPVARPP